MSEKNPIRIERFGPEIIEGAPSSRTNDFNIAISRGFHERAQEAEGLAVLAQIHVADGSEFTAVYDDDVVVPSWHAGKPVATYAAYPGTLNLGGKELLPAHQITAVTVSPTHRRRGILRSVITEDLQAAQANGLPVAILTASEATIYGRFGFGAVTERASFALTTARGANQRGPVTGNVIAVDPAELEIWAPELFAAAHAKTLGSVSHSRFDIGNSTGIWEEFDSLTPIKNLRAALHLDARGEVDGFITYEFSGWKAKTPALSIGQLSALNGAARRELIGYLAAHDLIEEITGRGPVDDVLRSALVNPRDYKVTRVGDHLWMRILDVPAVLGARSYTNDGKISLGVRDDLSLVNGVWELSVENSVPQVRRAPADKSVDATLDVRDLATLVMGMRTATHLEQAGLLNAHHGQALEILDLLFSTTATPYCQADF
ncbi:GNAT family N-acetyltransferase [Arthrobacter sp. MYb227]|uniref:GNAT family N-acetyltransferase n=1 Tax=Arthrobacter sp. MYb227 TaxID=1848601 RepID=UPI000CFB1ED2|nr:GNAT family N-acetyltransferase [Arthrobacter sp. MYb227]PQZ95745.1 GNAT family N-acetyltransferase [Arthrobacter sp. MYb227]